MHLILLLVIPTMILIGGKLLFKDTVTFKEFGIVYVALALCMTGGWFAAKEFGLLDKEIWGVTITSKDHGSQKCCHCRQVCDTCTRTNSEGRTETYSCNCHEVCQHPRDYWWSLGVSSGDKISIDSCNPRKHDEPAAWTAAYIGEPAAIEKTYKNYLKASPETVLTEARPEGMPGAPTFPRVHSFYKIRSLMNQGASVPEGAWQARLMELNADMGAKKQVHVTFITTKNPDPQYATAVMVDWLYGPKNSLNFVFGVEQDGSTIKWARVITLSDVEMLKIRARDEMPGMSLKDVDGVATYVRELVYKEFTRTPMESWEFLRAMAEPPGWLLGLLYFLSVALGVGGVYLAHAKDFFGDERRSRRWRC